MSYMGNEVAPNKIEELAKENRRETGVDHVEKILRILVLCG